MITMDGFDGKSDEELEKEIDSFVDHLHQFTVGLNDGYWVTMRARRVERSDERPHGLKYALTLHEPNDGRLLGYDNAHPVSDQSGPARKSKMPVAYDHVDEKGKSSRPYKFISPFQLVDDFWADVCRILKEE